MRRIRLVFAGLAVLLLVPLALVVDRALDTVARGREVRHETLAARVFLEVDRLLADLSVRESERAFGEYEFYLDGEGTRRSPLSRPPTEAYVAGYFQVDPDGTLHSPLVPRDPQQAASRGDWEAGRDAGVAARIESVVRRGIRARTEVVEEAPAFRREAGERLARSSALAEADALEQEQRDVSDEIASAPGVDSYQQALRGLDKGAERRVQEKVQSALKKRQAKAEPQRIAIASRPSMGVAVSGSPASAEPPARQLSEAASPEPAPATMNAPTAGGQSSWAFADRRDSKADLDVAAVVPEELASESAEGFAQSDDHQVVELSPPVGRVVGDYLVLYRSAIVGGDVYRQGVVLDVPALAGFVAGQVLAGGPLEGQAELGFQPYLPDARPQGDYLYQHRLADPFDQLGASLSLPQLADAEGVDYLYLISALLLVAGSAGLVALYRMVSVTVAFAERRSNFVAAVSHELKTPLTAIRMYSEMLRDGIVPSEEKRDEYVGTITAESERLTRLINNVLEFSRLEQDNREMSLVAGSLAPVVEEAARLLEPHARERGFEIRVEVDDELPPVRFDRDALLQIVFNLVDNALKYAREAGDRLVVLQVRARDGRVVLSVRDHGPGVASRHLSKIFEPFYRGEKELTRTAKGTGIGLALVKGLAERMGAAVRGINRDEGGFEVRLEFQAAA